jgi:phospholipid/cholesterol/gamma-HCH transport system substrate-binding protein
MRRALRGHSRDLLAIVGLIAAALFAVTVILVNQRVSLPSWVPGIGTDRFELKAEFSSAQAVTPGQGQSVTIAGIRVGEVSGVKLEDGHAVVSMEVDDDDAPLIHTNASLLLRPKTGLNDMVVEVDPGTQSAPVIKEGATVPLASTQPQVNPDEILASLDADTQQFLKLLLANGAEALDPAKGRDVKLSNALRRLEPFARDIARISGALASRRQNIASAIHNFQLLSTELGNHDQDLADFVDSSDAVLASFAKEQASIRGAVRELPGTLEETKGALKSSNRFAVQATPALKKLIPGAAGTASALRSLRSVFQETVEPIQNQIRPFTVQVRPAVTDLTAASQGLGATAPPAKLSFTRLNQLFNALSYQPGSDQSFLFYLPWLNHDTNLLFTAQDAHGPLRRGMVLESCATAQLAQNTFLARPFLRTLAQLTSLPNPPDLPGCS